jgi:Flp pilus assembly protein TadD
MIKLLRVSKQFGTYANTFLPLGLALMLAAPGLAMSAAEYRQMGLVYRQQEQYTEAIAAFQKAVELEPDDLSGRVLLGWTLHRAGQQDAAADTLAETAQRNPFYVPTLNALGIVYLVRGNLTQAAITHTWAAWLKPNNEIAYYNLSLALQRLQYFDWAITTAQEAAQLEPSNPHPLVALAIAHWSNGDSPAAQQAYRQAVALDARYNSLDFLQYLDEAGFSADQIQLSQLVQQATQ